MHWELWETESANLVETFDTEAEGLQAVREMLVVNRPDLLDSLVLGASYDEGEPRDVELPPVLDGETLKARLAEMAQEETAEAAHKVHARIRKWLAEEGWRVEDVHDPQSSFNVMVTMQGRPGINIFQLHDHLDHITLSERWIYGDELRSMFGQIPDDVLRDARRSILRDVTLIGVEFSGHDTPSPEMTLRTYVYFDGLTKDTLIQRILLTMRALTLAGQTLVLALDAQGHSGAHALSPEERRKLMRPMPTPEDALSRAG
jgi:hypothetical protein